MGPLVTVLADRPQGYDEPFASVVARLLIIAQSETSNYEER
jgi:hypothetical protein